MNRQHCGMGTGLSRTFWYVFTSLYHLSICHVLQPFTNHFPHANIHELLSPDLLHQVIKGTFKDHLVEWVTQYIESVHRKKHAKAILADIDHRYNCFTFIICRHYIINMLHILELQLCHCSQVYGVSLKAAASSSGRGMIPRLL